MNHLPAAAIDVQTPAVPGRTRWQFSLKRLGAWICATCVVLGIMFGPRRYATRVSVNYSSLPSVTAVHPRFARYEKEGLSEVGIAAREIEHILSAEICAKAVRLLADEGVPASRLGNDPTGWFKARVEITQQNQGGLQVRLRSWQPYHVGRKNHMRDTLAWKATVALMTAYQADAMGEGDQSFSGDGDTAPRDCRIPFLNFSYVEAGMW
jgi:hypothetical protein